MNELRTLLALELRSLFGINKALHTRDKKAKSRYMGLCVAWAMLIVMVFVYVGGLVYGLCILGLSQIVPAYLTVLSSLLILAFGLFTAGNRIFGAKGYDLLASLPVRSHSIVISRFLTLYFEDLLFTLVILLPGLTVYGICCQPELGFYLTALVGAVLIPVIPLVISVLLGTLILAVSSRMKSKSLVQSLLTVALVVGIMLGSFGMDSMEDSFTPEMFTQLAQTLARLFEKLYPPAMWLNNALCEGSIGHLLLFAGVSVPVAALAVYLVAKSYHTVSRRLGSFSAKHDYKIGAMESRGVLKALYFRELKRYFSSSIYVTNTITGPILGALMAIALCVTGMDALQLGIDIPSVLPFAFSAVFTMMTTTSVSISMEGKQFWVVKSLPISTKTLLDSKILLNLSLMLPFYLVALVAMVIAVQPSALELVWLAVIPAVIMLFAVVFGITVNLKSHSFDWEKEETVVKQSASALLGGFAGFLLSAALGIGAFLLPSQYADPAKALACLVLLGITLLLYRKNNRAALNAL